MTQAPLAISDYTGRVGPHLTRIEDDVLCLKLMGLYTPDEARQVLTIADAHYDRYGTTYLLNDVSQALTPPLETRKVIANWPLRGRYGATAYGFSWSQRVLMQLMAASRRLLNKVTIDLYFAESEADGRRWIAEHRRSVQSAK